jgi:hypothetical protein
MTTDPNHVDSLWMGTIYGTNREVLITDYADGTRTVAWRPDQWSTWEPWTDLRPAP